jgi:hypothetical protein
MTNHDRFASVFSNRMGQTFSTADIEKLMVAESDIQRGSVLPNDHGTGNKGQCDCVATDRQIFDRVGRGSYRVRQFRHFEASTAAKVTGSPRAVFRIPAMGQSGGCAAQVAVYRERPEDSARKLWNSTDSKDWDGALDHYWALVKPSNLQLEREMARLDAETVRLMNAAQWYEFLLERYFRWKYTAPNRYASTTKLLRGYGENGQLALLYDIKERLFSFDKRNIAQGLSLASSIRGLGTAGASGLLAVLFPTYFGTVDQFVVKAFVGIPELQERNAIAAMNPESLTVRDGIVLIEVMRRKAAELNKLFSATKWTPRKVDMVFWAHGR